VRLCKKTAVYINKKDCLLFHAGMSSTKFHFIEGFIRETNETLDLTNSTNVLLKCSLVKLLLRHIQHKHVYLNSLVRYRLSNAELHKVIDFTTETYHFNKCKFIL